MYDVGLAKTMKTREIDGLIQQGSRIGIAAKPLKPRGKARVDGNELDLVALASKRFGQRPCLDPLPS